MLNARMEAALAVRRELRPTEDAVDRTLGQLGMLIHTTCHARLATKAPAHLGQNAIDELTSAAAMLGSVRGKILAAHTSLAHAHHELMPTVAIGDDGCPSQNKAQSELRVVA